MGGAMAGWGVDMIADCNLSAGNEQALELGVELWDAARMAELGDGLQ
jgi:hypothetical protein